MITWIATKDCRSSFVRGDKGKSTKSSLFVMHKRVTGFRKTHVMKVHETKKIGKKPVSTSWQKTAPHHQKGTSEHLYLQVWRSPVKKSAPARGRQWKYWTLKGKNWQWVPNCSWTSLVQAILANIFSSHPASVNTSSVEWSMTSLTPHWTNFWLDWTQSSIDILLLCCVKGTLKKSSFGMYTVKIKLWQTRRREG